MNTERGLQLSQMLFWSIPGDVLVTARFMGRSALARVLPDVEDSSHCGSLESLPLRHICRHHADRFKGPFCSEL